MMNVRVSISRGLYKVMIPGRAPCWVRPRGGRGRTSEREALQAAKWAYGQGRRRNPQDEDMRDLARRAKQGDAEAHRRLARARRRAGGPSMWRGAVKRTRHAVSFAKRVAKLQDHTKMFLGRNGKFISYTSLGSYPVLYMDGGGNYLCAACADEVLKRDDYGREGIAGLVGDVYYEGPPVQCDGWCRGTIIESAYGDPDEDRAQNPRCRNARRRNSDADATIRDLARRADQGDADAFKKIHAEIRRRGILPPGWSMHHNKHGWWATAPFDPKVHPSAQNTKWFPGMTTYPTEAAAIEAARGAWFISWNARNGWTGIQNRKQWGLREENPRQRPAGNKCGNCKHHISMHSVVGAYGHGGQGPGRCGSRGCTCQHYIQKGARYYPSGPRRTNPGSQHHAGPVGRFLPERSAWAMLRPEFKSTQTGWSTAGEFYCPYCSTSIGKNLRGDTPYMLAMQHLQEHRGRGRKSNPSDFSCSGCKKPFGHGRALYVPSHDIWFHDKCFKMAPLPSGTQAFKRTPTRESLAKFAAHDQKYKRTNPNRFPPVGQPSLQIVSQDAHDQADELVMFAENTYELNGQRESIIKNLLRKIAGKRYDYRQAPKLWGYWVESAAKRYVREMPDGRPWNVVFPPQVRAIAAARLAKDFEWEVQNGMGWSYPEWEKAKAALGKKKENPGRVEFLGWVMGRDRSRYGDETGVMHKLVSTDGRTVHTLCGTRGVGGQTEGKGPQPPRGHACGNCAKRKSNPGISKWTTYGGLDKGKSYDLHVPEGRYMIEPKIASSGPRRVLGYILYFLNEKGLRKDRDGLWQQVGTSGEDVTTGLFAGSDVVHRSPQAAAKAAEIHHARFAGRRANPQDAEIRRLERLASQGDHSAAMKLRHMSRRQGGGRKTLVSSATVRRGFKAFHGQTGGIVGQAAQTAMDLARAEAEAKQRGWTVSVSPAWESYQDVYGEEPPPGTMMLNVDLLDRKGELIQSLLTSTNDENDPYLREVGAELAYEALRTKRGGAHRGIAGRLKNPRAEVSVGGGRVQYVEAAPGSRIAVVRSAGEKRLDVVGYTNGRPWARGRHAGAVMVAGVKSNPSRRPNVSNDEWAQMSARELGYRIRGKNVVSVRRRPLRGDYDSSGRYWGAGLPLWDVETEEGDVYQLRARDRDYALSAVQLAGAYLTGRKKNPVHTGGLWEGMKPWGVTPDKYLPPVCKRCKGAGQVKLGKNLVNCPMCQRKTKNPLNAAETGQLVRTAKASMRVSEASKGVRGGQRQEAWHAGAAMGRAQAALAYGADVPWLGDARTVSDQALDVVQRQPAKRKKNPLDGHKPGCMCWFHKKQRGGR